MRLLILIFASILTFSAPLFAQESNGMEAAKEDRLRLITDTPDEGFALAIQLVRRSVTTIQTDKSILHKGREEYARDPDSLIAASHVVAIYFQTVAEANNYWRD